MGYEAVLDAIEEQGLVVASGYDNLSFRCPAHDDNRASGSHKEVDDGAALLYCHAGCETEDVVAALGLQMKDLFVERGRHVEAYYEYRDEKEEVLYRVVRFKPKGFTQERWTADMGFVSGLQDTRRVLYNLPAVLGEEKEPIYLVEGEKDVERLRAEGVVATRRRWLSVRCGSAQCTAGSVPRPLPRRLLRLRRNCWTSAVGNEFPARNWACLVWR